MDSFSTGVCSLARLYRACGTIGVEKLNCEQDECRTISCRCRVKKSLIHDVLREEMKRIVTIGIVAACFAGCASTALETKSWHVSPDRNPMSADLYGFAEWPVVQKLHVGMSVSDAKELVGILQSYHHPVNAIVFTKHRGQEYEVALKLSKDKKSIEDISYKRRK
jgi:hypothetical protein